MSANIATTSLLQLFRHNVSKVPSSCTMSTVCPQGLQFTVGTPPHSLSDALMARGLDRRCFTATKHKPVQPSSVCVE